VELELCGPLDLANSKFCINFFHPLYIAVAVYNANVMHIKKCWNSDGLTLCLSETSPEL
jgi:hypothetical protein